MAHKEDKQWTVAFEGEAASGRFKYTTTLWNKVSDGSWISDAFTWTGTGNPVSGMC